MDKFNIAFKKWIKEGGLDFDMLRVSELFFEELSTPPSTTTYTDGLDYSHLGEPLVVIETSGASMLGMDYSHLGEPLLVVEI